MTKQHPVDAALFGPVGAYAATFCEDITKEFYGKQFEFMDPKKFGEIKDLTTLNQIYWKELLFRAYWAAALNIMRHQRWQAACVAAFTPCPNLLSFTAALRGLVEASADAFYSLRPVPVTLAENQDLIEPALQGTLQDVGIIQELEDRLIHFVYGRKLAKTEKATTPNSHVALEPKEYRNAMGLPEMERIGFAQLYDELCGFCHPTGFSLAFLWHQDVRENATTVHITSGRDDERILAFCRKFENTIQLALSLSVTASALCLKMLNRFSLLEVRSATIERWNFDDIPAWRKIEASLPKNA